MGYGLKGVGNSSKSKSIVKVKSQQSKLLFQFSGQEFHEIEPPGDTDVGGEDLVFPRAVCIESRRKGHHAVEHIRMDTQVGIDARTVLHTETVEAIATLIGHQHVHIHVGVVPYSIIIARGILFVTAFGK